MVKTILQLEELAEIERCAGHRQKFLELEKQIEDVRQEELLSRHNQQVENVKKEFPVGFYIPDLHATVKEIKDGCGTQRGWIDIYLTGYEKPVSYCDLRVKIRKAKETKEASAYFDKLKFSDTKQSLYIGEKDYETLECLIKVMSLDLPTVEELDECNIDWSCQVMTEAKQQAIKDGFTDEEAETKSEEAEGEEMSRMYEEHLSAILKTMNYLLNFHGIELEAQKKGYYLTAKSWKVAAEKVRETINGMGPFYYESVKEFKDVGPYKSYCEAAISHLHWLKDYPRVYGHTEYRRIYER